MDAGQLKDLLTINDVYDLLDELGAAPILKGDQITCRTICHGGNKHKLIYYHDSKKFSCFTGGCGHGWDLYNLIEKVFAYDFPNAYRYVASKFNVVTDGYVMGGEVVDTSFIKKFKIKEDQHILEEISSNLLNSFYKLYHKMWIEDNISIKTMLKFNILFSIKENKIIIPHFDVDSRLLGIRGRALNEDEIQAGKKYMPIFHKGKVRKHPTGGNIYGLNRTKQDVLRYKTIILFESEKGVMQLDTLCPDMSIGGAVSGSSLTDEQVRIIRGLEIENVILALDKEFSDPEEELFYKKKVKAGFIDKLLPYFKVSVIWDQDNLLELKDSPTDKGLEVFETLFKKRIFIN